MIAEARMQERVVEPAAELSSTAIADAGSLQEHLAAVGYAKVIVVLRPVRPESTATMLMAATASAGASIESHFIVPGGSQLAGLAMPRQRTRGGRQAARAEPATMPRVRMYPRLGLAIGYVDVAGLAALEREEAVGSVVKAPELSLIRPVASRPATLGRDVSWGVKRLSVERLWDAGFKGKGVVVGHLDTGVDGTHPALNGAIAAFAQFDMAANQVANAAPTDSGAHGTHTAGTIVGRSGAKGPFGVAPEAQLASAMVIEGGQVIDRMLAGMEWLVSQNVRIISMSAGLRGYTSAFEAIVDALRAANVLPVFAVGNDGPLTSRSPGNYAKVLSVGAINSADIVADFSSSQRLSRQDDPNVPDLVAPGVGVLSCIPGGRYAEYDGTSMATPHIAGLAALLLQAKPDATADQLEDVILRSCSLPTGMDPARGNRGVPDAVTAFRLLTGTELPLVTAARAMVSRSPTTSRHRSTVSKSNKRSKKAVKRTKLQRQRKKAR